MTITLDPITISTLVALILASVSVFVWMGKLSNRVDRLESDVSELKEGQKQILELLHQHIGYHSGLVVGASPGAIQPGG